MTDDEIRRLREALYVLQEQLIRNLISDAFETSEAEPLNFFRVYRGALMDGIVVDWWKIFGNRAEDSHWTSILPDETHHELREEISSAFADMDPSEEFDAVWDEAKKYRNTAAAHLDFDDARRAKVFPRLSPLRVSAEIVYRRIFELLDGEGRANGIPLPTGVTGANREKNLEHHRQMVSASREALKEFKNTP